MRRQYSSFHRISGVAAFLLLAAVSALAQQRRAVTPQRASAYDLSHETALQGTVLKYTEYPGAPPLGARVTVQTASGTVEVHLGDAKLLKLAKFSLTEGSSIRVVGENLPSRHGSMFVARLVQQGNQVLAVRTPNGMPLAAAGIRGQLSSGRLPHTEGAR